MYFADTFKVKKNIENDLTIKNILIIGILQILAIIPGVSRAGITITAGRFLNFDRHDSTKISFYLSIPALTAPPTPDIAIWSCICLSILAFDKS